MEVYIKRKELASYDGSRAVVVGGGVVVYGVHTIAIANGKFFSHGKFY